MRLNRALVVVSLGLLGSLWPLTANRAGSSSAQAQVQSEVQAFQQVWSRTDSLVQSGMAKRSFYWGNVGGQPMYERYDEGPGGKHLVQYFDKSRMEINDPNGNPSNPFFVTNGQLARELITGRVQVGNNNFVQLPAAQVAIASDTSDTAPGTPTYASFAGVMKANPRQVGQHVDTTINRAGQVGTDQSYWAQYHVSYAYYEPATQNSIPDVFWTFLNATGPVIINGRPVTARLNDPYFYATGYPISAAYWARVVIAGKPNTAVLIQPYERRVLTYVPSAPEGWRVQMGNVGLHYSQWRYHAWGSPCNAPDGKTAGLWFARPEVQQNLGCIIRELPEIGVTVAHQQFEHGEMLDLIRSSTLKTIYVLFEDGTAQYFADTYGDGNPEPQLSPPPGLYAPLHGFGKVWSEQNLGERLGWATAPETVANQEVENVPTPPPVPTPPSSRGFPAVRTFALGNLIIYTGPALHKFYVLYQSDTRWTMYEDAP